VHVFDDADGENQIEIFRAPVLFRSRFHAGGEFLRLLAAPDLNAGRPQLGGNGREKILRDRLVHEQRLHRVADGGALNLRVEADLLRHGDRRLVVDIDVADAFVVLDHGNARILRDGADQLLASARNDEVYIVFELEQLVDKAAVFRLGD